MRSPQATPRTDSFVNTHLSRKVTVFLRSSFIIFNLRGLSFISFEGVNIKRYTVGKESSKWVQTTDERMFHVDFVKQWDNRQKCEKSKSDLNLQ